MTTRADIWDTARELLRDKADMAEEECDASLAQVEADGDLFRANSWFHIKSAIGRLRRGERRPPD
jgi:hypothetical protein